MSERLLELDPIPGSDYRSPRVEPENSPASLTASPATAPEIVTPAPAIVAKLAADRIEPVRDETGRAVASGPGVDADDVQRALDDEKLAREAGFAAKPQIFALGTPVNSLGRDNFRKSRQQVDDLPLTLAAMPALRNRVRAECRTIVEVPSNELRMLDDGRITRGREPLAVTRPGWRAIAQQVTKGGAAWLEKQAPDVRAWNFNRLIGDHSGSLRLRVRRSQSPKAETSHEIWGVVGPRYTPFDADEAATLIEQIAPDARCDVTYDGYNLQIDLVWHSDIKPEHAVSGEFFKSALRFRSADDGAGRCSNRLDAMLWRNLCLNLIIVDQAGKKILRQRHVGDAIAERITAGFERGLDSLAPFISKWGEASQERILDEYGLDADGAFRALVQARVVHVPGVKPEAMIERLTRAYAAEPDNLTRAGIVNAITRAAHSDPWSYGATEDLEATAGQLIAHQRVFARAMADYEPEATSA